MSKLSQVYLIGKVDNCYKIGFSNNPEGRLRSYAPLLPIRPAVYHSITTSRPRWLEKVLHHAFRHRHVRGEWFRLQPDDVALFREMVRVQRLRELPKGVRLFLKAHGYKSRVNLNSIKTSQPSVKPVALTIHEKVTGDQPKPKIDRPPTDWLTVLRDGFIPTFETAGIMVVLGMLKSDDSRIVQGETTIPKYVVADGPKPCEKADVISCVGWFGKCLTENAEVEEYFAKSCYEADARFGWVAACKPFLNWFDDTPRSEVWPKLIAEFEAALAHRELISAV